MQVKACKDLKNFAVDSYELQKNEIDLYKIYITQPNIKKSLHCPIIILKS